LELKTNIKLRTPMIVCHCRAVSDRDIEKCIDEGATCPGSIAARSGAGSECGGCQHTIVKLIQKRSERAQQGLLPRLIKAY
jgi:bacterioferritin-associated ferredoxin